MWGFQKVAQKVVFIKKSSLQSTQKGGLTDVHKGSPTKHPR